MVLSGDRPPAARPHGLGPGDLRRLAALVVGGGAVVAAAALLHERGPLLCGVVAAAGLAWARFVEPRILTVTRIRVESVRLPAGSRPIRAVHVTDLQSDARARLEERLPAAVERERPDLIVFTGDAVNSREGAPVFRRCLARLAGIAPTFAVRGNWETWNVPDADPFGGTGAVLLEATAASVHVEGTDVWIVGLGADQGERGGEALAPVPAGAPTLFLHHYPYPEVVPETERARVDLMLAGHVHGGQIALPFYGAILTLNRHGKRYEHGLHRVGPMRLFVSRGIGMDGRGPRLRFFAPPEIAVIDLVPGRESTG